MALSLALPLALGGCGASTAASPASTGMSASPTPSSVTTSPGTATSTTPAATPSATAGAACDEHPVWKTSSNALQPIALPRPGVPVPAHRLVPSESPVSMVLCRYRFDTAGQQATLLGSRTITNPGAAAMHFASEAPASASARSCTLIKVVDTGYVAILTYGAAGASASTTGTVYLLVPGHNECEGTSNASTVSATNDAAEADTAFASGTWPA